MEPLPEDATASGMLTEMLCPLPSEYVATLCAAALATWRGQLEGVD